MTMKRGRATEFIDQVVDVTGRPFSLRVGPAEQPVLGSIPTKVKLARLRVVQPAVSLPLNLDEIFELVRGAPRRRAVSLISVAQESADRFGHRGRQVGVVDEHHHDHALVEDVHDPSAWWVVAKRGQGAVEMILAVLDRSFDRAFAVLVLGDDPPFG